MNWRKLRPWCVPCQYHDNTPRTVVNVTFVASEELNALEVWEYNKMVGNNTLFINQAEMNAAIEYYLNNVVLKSPCVVQGVSYTTNRAINGFEVTLLPPKADGKPYGAFEASLVEK